MSRRRVAITGGLGFIGQSVLHRWAAEADVLVIDNLHPQVHRNRSVLGRVPQGVIVLEQDVTDPATADRLAAFEPDVLVHLAAETGTGQSLRHARRHAHVNVTGTATILDGLAARSSSLRKVILTSSRAVYGEGDWIDARGNAFHAVPRSGTQLAARQWSPLGPDGQVGTRPMPHSATSVPPRPANVYAATKLAQENIAGAWCAAFGVPLVVLRLQNVFGSGQAIDNPYTGVLTYMARQALAGEQIRVFEGGQIVRDFVHISDVANALDAALHKPLEGAVTIDIGSGSPVSLVDVAGLLSSLVNGRVPVVTDDYRLGDVRAAFADLACARQTLGFRPSTELVRGLQDLLTWVEAAP